MLSPFIINQLEHPKQAILNRYPAIQVNRSLQAWDSADELLISYVQENALVKETTKILVVNDAFGALAINFSENDCFSWSDSYISHLGAEANFVENGLNVDNFHKLSSLDPIPQDIDVVLVKIPKTKALLIEQLILLKNTLSDNAVIIAADKAKNIQTATLKLFEKYLGTTTTSLAVKKSRLVFAQMDNKEQHCLPEKVTWPLENSNLSLSHYANVFAKEKLDIGARLFLAHFPEFKNEQEIIDLGCGNGVIGLNVLTTNKNLKVTFVDESYMAVASAKMNVTNNLPEKITDCQFLANDCLAKFEQKSADIVLCNPPFHQQHATTDHIAWQMFKDSYNVLKEGGELRIVGNRQLGYHIKLKRIFGNCKTVASNSKFVILTAIKK